MPKEIASNIVTASSVMTKSHVNVITGCYAESIAQIKHKKYEQSLEPVLVNDDCKILWDFNVQTDIVIEQWRPHIVYIDSLHSDTW